MYSRNLPSSISEQEKIEFQFFGYGYHMKYNSSGFTLYYKKDDVKKDSDIIQST